MDGWDNFFVATAGAAVAFAGLVLVSVSINLDRIVKQPGLVNRSAEPLIVLFSLFVVSSIVLIPNQRVTFYGFELLFVGAAAAIVLGKVLDTQRGYAADAERIGVSPGNSYRFRAIVCGIVVISILAAGALLAVENEKGVYLLVPAMVAGFLISFVEAWVLLIEIDR